MLRASGIYLIIALLLAWSMVGLHMKLPFLMDLFPGDFQRLLSAHLDFLIMTALLLALASTRISFPGIVRWAMVIGAFTNSSVFLILAMFPAYDHASGAYALSSGGTGIYKLYSGASFIITTIGFGGAAITLIRTGFLRKA